MNEENKDYDGGDTVERRLIRLESKLVRGFEELGVDLDVKRKWLTVDNLSKSVEITTMGRSLLVIQQKMKEEGASNYGDWYSVFYRGDEVARVLFDPPA
jgi:hypothetical protein